MLAELERRSEENRKLYEDLRMTYSDTVKAFAAAIDCKDKYTEGHSVRVGKYSEIIGRELGWGEDEIEGAAVAGYLHDVGKLTVERKIINAPYRINAKESAELNKHPAVGFEILSADPSSVYGRSPCGKISSRTPRRTRLSGRPVRPADTVYCEDRNSCRLVRCYDDRPSVPRRRPANEVFDDLQRNSGKQFAPELVSAFFRGILKELQGETKEKQFRKLLGREYMETEGLATSLKNSLNGMTPTSSLTMIQP